MKPIVECLETIGAARSDVENWINRFDLSSGLAPTVAGRARLYSYLNVLELASIAAFRDAGWQPSTCLAMASAVVRNAKAGGRQREWLVFPTESPSGYLTDTLDGDRIAKEAAATGGIPVVKIVAIGEIVRRVKKLFADEAN